jgi:hypothetical protein
MSRYDKINLTLEEVNAHFSYPFMLQLTDMKLWNEIFHESVVHSAQYQTFD